MNQQQHSAAAGLERKASGPVAAQATPEIATLLQAALQHHQAGHLAEAEAHYRQVLAATPEQAQVLFNLALALKQQGKLGEAAAAYRQTIALMPDYADAHYNLANLLLGRGQLDAAVARYGDAVRLKPEHADAHCNLGVALKAQGKLDEAIAALHQAIVLAPDHAEAYGNLAESLTALGRLDEAVAAYRQAIRVKPDHAGAYGSLGAALTRQGKHEEALLAYRRAVALAPDNPQAHYNLGNALKQQGRPAEAAAAYRQAIAREPDLLEAHVNRGNALCELGRYDEAVAAYRRAIALKPDNAAVHYNLGNALKDQGKLEEAALAYRRAIGLQPDYADAHANLAIVLTDQGRRDEALSEYACAIERKPDDASIYSNYLLCLNYSDSETAESLFAAHREWDKRYGRPAPQTYANDRTPGRRLKIGYVSPDLRAHSVAYFLQPLLQAYDRQAVEVFCYAEVMRPDAVTARLQALADHWRSTVGVSDAALAERIRSDGIDILVDLAGHTAWNRLPVFARKPAPVQVNWLGYPNTTGLAAIDYRLVDAVTDPPGAADLCASETLLRLDGFLCYGGAQDAPEPAPPPCLESGTITFGSFNNPAKLSTVTLDAWAQLLARLPQARLLLKGKPFSDAATRALLSTRLAERGVATDRIELVGWLAGSADHLALYERIDIALDPFPYNGTTTTCEALWMGVPVVTLKGERHCGRVGASLLGQIGLHQWIAGTIDDYGAIAVALAENPETLRALRRDLRPRLAASPLCDGAAFARRMEDAFRAMWRRWCAAASGDKT